MEEVGIPACVGAGDGAGVGVRIGVGTGVVVAAFSGAGPGTGVTVPQAMPPSRPRTTRYIGRKRDDIDFIVILIQYEKDATGAAA